MLFILRVVFFYFIALTSGGSFSILTLPDFTWPTFVGKKNLNQNNKKKTKNNQCNKGQGYSSTTHGQKLTAGEGPRLMFFPCSGFSESPRLHCSSAVWAFEP